MAFSVLLASASDDEVIAFREGRQLVIHADLSVNCSHLLTSWVYQADLREVLREAIDVGQNLQPDLWHPMRTPVWRPSMSVHEFEPKLRTVWSDNLEKFGPADPTDWYIIEIGKVVEVFRHAAASRNGVVSFLGKPMDEERASRVLIPVTDRTVSA